MGNIISSLGSLGSFLKGLLFNVVSHAEEVVEHQTIDVNNIQGDIILGLPKQVERFSFYQITDVQRFRENLSKLVPMITTMKNVEEDRKRIDDNKAARGRNVTPPLLPISGINIAFSHIGLKKLGKAGDLGDLPFKNGQKAESKGLGDPTDPSNPSEPNWIPEFRQSIDLIILITGETHKRITERAEAIDKIFGINTPNACLHTVLTLDGKVRPGEERAHEHFGYRDGISQPGITKYTTLKPGQEAVPPGIALCRNVGDPQEHFRPGWSKDGSFLVFRYLEQLVPEFDDFVSNHPIQIEGLDKDEQIALAGARLIGRWKSGAPIDIAPVKDQPGLGSNPDMNNKFDFSIDGSQNRCPYAAHIRKGNPRSDLSLLGGTRVHRIWRQGIPYGPEVTPEERQQKKTLHSRGLCFVCYSSSIDEGFSFIQQAWCNNPAFPPKIHPSTSGYDPIVGLNGGNARDMFDPKAAGGDLRLPINWVVPKGGEYFFSPSISTLRDDLALAQKPAAGAS